MGRRQGDCAAPRRLFRSSHTAAYDLRATDGAGAALGADDTVVGGEPVGMFGPDESITCIEDVALKGGNGEPLCLAYKRTIVFVFAGVYVKDDGYVLKPKAEARTYYPMPTATELDGFQAAGLLPRPLPPYSLSAWDYLFGYSLWIVIAGVVAVELVKKLVRGNRPALSAAGPEPPPT